jgi:hypothetical protein
MILEFEGRTEEQTDANTTDQLPSNQADFGPLSYDIGQYGVDGRIKGPHSLCAPPISSPSLGSLWAKSVHMHLGWASVSWTERD